MSHEYDSCHNILWYYFSKGGNESRNLGIQLDLSSCVYSANYSTRGIPGSPCPQMIQPNSNNDGCDRREQVPKYWYKGWRHNLFRPLNANCLIYLQTSDYSIQSHLGLVHRDHHSESHLNGCFCLFVETFGKALGTLEWYCVCMWV